jgi:oligopeptidase A
VALPTEQKQRFAAIEERLSAICAKFADNLLDATQAWHKATITRSRVSKAFLKQSRFIGAISTTTGLNRPYCYFRCARLFSGDDVCRQPSTTRNRCIPRIAHAPQNSANDGKFDNSVLMEEILALRYEQAQLLGYQHYAELSLVPKMASSVAVVMQFLQELASTR